MLELSQILGITVNELLSGEEIHMENYEIKADENLLALKARPPERAISQMTQTTIPTIKVNE